MWTAKAMDLKRTYNPLKTKHFGTIVLFCFFLFWKALNGLKP